MTVLASLSTLPRRTLIFLIELYRTWISPMRLPTCRFEPTCSSYAVEALEVHGFWYGSALSIWRLLKCGPWHKPGYDPVPEPRGRARRPIADGDRSQTSHTTCGSSDDDEPAMSDRGH